MPIEPPPTVHPLEPAEALASAGAGTWCLHLTREAPGPEPDALRVSPDVTALIGYEVDAFPDTWTAFLDRILPVDRPAVHQALDDHLAGRTHRFNPEFRIRHRDGSVVRLTVLGRTTYDDRGRPVCVSGIAFATDSHRAPLSDPPGETERLRQALLAFSFTVSHDLRAPLRAIRGFAEIIQSRYGAALPAEALRYVDNIVTAGRRMHRMLDDLVAYNRMMRRVYVLERVFLPDILEPLAAHYRPEARRLGGEIEIAPDLPAVVGHPDLLERVFSSLLDNAMKFRRPDVAPRIAVTADADDGTARLHCTDNGLGISGEHYERIFGIFQRLHSTEAYPGTGIGLAVVQKALDVMNGRVTVTSRPGEGSTFTVHLPLP